MPAKAGIHAPGLTNPILVPSFEIAESVVYKLSAYGCTYDKEKLP